MRIKELFKIFFASGVIIGVFALPVGVQAQFDPLAPACQNVSSDVCDPQTVNPIVGDQGLLTRVTNILTVVTAVIAVIVIVIAGLTMTLSGGNSQKVQQSRDAIIYAAVAIAVALLARAIVLFVAGNLKNG